MTALTNNRQHRHQQLKSMFLLRELLLCRQTPRVQELCRVFELTLSTNSDLHDQVVDEVCYYLEHEQLKELDEYHEHTLKVQALHDEIASLDRQLYILNQPSPQFPYSFLSTKEMVYMIEEATRASQLVEKATRASQSVEEATRASQLVDDIKHEHEPKPIDASIYQIQTREIQTRQTQRCQTERILTVSIHTQTTPKLYPHIDCKEQKPQPQPEIQPLQAPEVMQRSKVEEKTAAKPPLQIEPVQIPEVKVIPQQQQQQQLPQLQQHHHQQPIHANNDLKTIPKIHLPPQFSWDSTMTHEKQPLPLFTVHRKTAPFHLSEDTQKKISEKVRMNMNVVPLRKRR